LLNIARLTSRIVITSWHNKICYSSLSGCLSKLRGEKKEKKKTKKKEKEEENNKKNKEKTKKNNGRAPLALRGRRSLVA